jgi:hypothetical protein
MEVVLKYYHHIWHFLLKKLQNNVMIFNIHSGVSSFIIVLLPWIIALHIQGLMVPRLYHVCLVKLL